MGHFADVFEGQPPVDLEDHRFPLVLWKVFEFEQDQLLELFRGIVRTRSSGRRLCNIGPISAANRGALGLIGRQVSRDGKQKASDGIHGLSFLVGQQPKKGFLDDIFGSRRVRSQRQSVRIQAAVVFTEKAPGSDDVSSSESAEPFKLVHI